jgi:hypothetical protein
MATVKRILYSPRNQRQTQTSITDRAQDVRACKHSLHEGEYTAALLDLAALVAHAVFAAHIDLVSIGYSTRWRQQQDAEQE